MKSFIIYFLYTFLNIRRVALANDAGDKRRAGLVGLSNEATVGKDGWVRISPYGDHEKIRSVLRDGVVVEEKYIQRVTLANSRRMADQHNSFFGKLMQLRRGAPIFRGHADRWDVAKQEGVQLPMRQPKSGKEKLGMFAQLEARADGFYGLPVFEDAAQVAIENDGLKWFSPFWWADIVTEENGIPVAEPVEFISAALTAHPNISGGHALANEYGDDADSQTTNPEDPMNKKLLEKILGICRAQGIALANEEESTIEAAFDQLNQRLTQRTALENEKTTKLTPRITALENEVQAEKDAHTTTRTALENERSAFADTLVDLAIAEGRIAPSERVSKRALFGAKGESFAAGRIALENEAVKYHVTPKTTAARKETASTVAKPALRPSQQLIALANSKLTKGEASTFEDAYEAAKAEKPELVAAMEEATKATE